MGTTQKQALQDPVCGMMVDEKTATGHVAHEGVDYHFCCPRCQKQFEEDPAKYLNRKASLPVVSSSNCGCGCAEPAKQEIVQLAPSLPSSQFKGPTTPALHHDPVCGMDIEEQDAAGTVEHNGTLHYFCS